MFLLLFPIDVNYIIWYHDCIVRYKGDRNNEPTPNHPPTALTSAD